MKILFPLSTITEFYLNKAGYTRDWILERKDAYLVIYPRDRKYESSNAHNEFKLHPYYIPKVLTDTSLLDQIPLLVALGLSWKEIIEILRS